MDARTGSAAMAMVTARTEKNYHIVGFSTALVPLRIHDNMSLREVCNVIDKVCRTTINWNLEGWHPVAKSPFFFFWGGGGGGGGGGSEGFHCI